MAISVGDILGRLKKGAKRLPRLALSGTQEVKEQGGDLLEKLRKERERQRRERESQSKRQKKKSKEATQVIEERISKPIVEAGKKTGRAALKGAVKLAEAPTSKPAKFLVKQAAKDPTVKLLSKPFGKAAKIGIEGLDVATSRAPTQLFKSLERKRPTLKEAALGPLSLFGKRGREAITEAIDDPEVNIFNEIRERGVAAGIPATGALLGIAGEIAAPGPELGKGGKVAKIIGEERAGLMAIKNAADVPDILKVDESLVAREADKLNPTQPPSSRGASVYRQARDKTESLWIKAREAIQDDWIRVKKLVKDKNTYVTEANNPYEAEVRMHGRVSARVEDIKSQVADIDKRIVKTTDGKKAADELTQDVNDYLHARHAPERNSRLGDGAAGLTDSEAAEIITRLGKKKSFKAIQKFSNEIRELNKQTLDILRDGQVINDETYNLLTDTYKEHVPLQRIFSEEENVSDVLSGAGLDVKGTGIQRAVGSEREVNDIISNVTANVEAAVIRSEKNLVDLHTLRFARENPQLDLFEEVKPKAIGETFEGKPLLERIDDPQVLHIRENGESVFLHIKDANIAAAFKGINKVNVPAAVRWIGSITRLYGGIHTRFNPEFAFSNNFRDIQEMMVEVGSRKEMGFGKAVSAAVKDPLSKKGVVDWILGRDTAGAKLYDQMRLDGGTTGGLGLTTRTKIDLDIAKIRKINRSNPRKGAEMLLKGIDNWNTVFEDATRLSVYKTALDSGISRSKAAVMAKESTINFNKRGTGGPIINSLYMFSNASIQGSTKMLRAMKNPKILGSVVGGLGVATVAVNDWNDKVDPDWRNKFSDWERRSNFVVMVPNTKGKFQSVKLPLSWGLKPIKVAMDYSHDFYTGNDTDIWNATTGVLGSFFEAYNPLAGDESLINTITPTVGKLPNEIRSNIAWHGGKIRPDWDDDLPASGQFFSSIKDSASGRAALGISQKLSKETGGKIEVSPEDIQYAYEQLVGGAGKFSTRVVNTGIGVFKGEGAAAKDIPVVNRFFKSVTDEEAAERSLFKQKEELEKQEARTRGERKLRVDGIIDDLNNLPESEHRNYLGDLKNNGQLDKKTFDSVKKKIKENSKGLSDFERSLKNAPVSVRAQSIQSNLDSVPDKKAYLSDLKEKGILTKSVFEEVKKLEDNPEPLSRGRKSNFLANFGKITAFGSPIWSPGLDVDLAVGDPVPTPIAGTVVFAGRNGGFGNQVKVRDANGYEMWLSHLSTINVEAGDEIGVGQRIGQGGNTGTVIRGPGGDGSHLDITVKRPDGTFERATTIAQKLA